MSELCRPGGDLLSQVLRLSTIGAKGFNGRVRDGIGFWAPCNNHQIGEAHSVSRGCRRARCQRASCFCPCRPETSNHWQPHHFSAAGISITACASPRKCLSAPLGWHLSRLPAVLRGKVSGPATLLGRLCRLVPALAGTCIEGPCFHRSSRHGFDLKVF